MSSKYLPKEFEKKWVDAWEKEEVYKTGKPDKKNPKVYALSMFPYPSAAGLHVGHVRIYTGMDVLARYLRMKGKAVLHPMGWDAFGLPAENAAIAAEKNPIDMVPENIKNFKRQMKMLGFSYDWESEFATTDPDYYKWTQWFFIQFFKMGLLYKKQTPVYFCPHCQTGLAEEEVLPDGTHERCGHPITRKELPQWIFKITTYADRLLKDLEGLDWPKGILEMQKNWIGRKEGINITYKVKNSNETITCFTTRPETNFGATFIVLAPEHQLVKKLKTEPDSAKSTTQKSKLMKDLKKVDQYVKQALAKTDLERIAEGRAKTGVFTGFYAVNDLNDKLMPIWISDFVLPDIGTAAVVGVPGHDVRDFEFAKEFGLEIVRVVVGPDGDRAKITKKEQVRESSFAEATEDKGGVMINSGFLDGLPTEVAKEKIMDYLEKKGWGKRTVSYHLRDWIFSRQRYWGEPIPLIYCKTCAEKGILYWDVVDKLGFQNNQFLINLISKKNPTSKSQLSQLEQLEIRNSLVGWFPVPDDELPLKLPYLKSYQPTETGQSPLAKVKDWVKTRCPNCGGEARRETDTMPNWAGSCWYFIRFAQTQKSTHSAGSGPSALSSGSKRLILSQVEGSKLKVKNYSSKLKSDKKIKPPSMEQWNNLPAGRQGVTMKQWLPVDWYLGGAEHAVLHLLYSRFWVKALQDLGLLDFPEPFLRLRNVGMVLGEDGRKMSKSFGNVINPDDVIEEYGTDTLRIYEMFMAPFSSEIVWSTRAVQGTYRFLSRIWQTYHNSDSLTKDKNKDDKDLALKLQRTIFKVSSDITNVKFNTAIAAMMEFINFWERPATGNRTPEVEEERSDGKTSGVKRLSHENGKKFLQILAPFAPFMAEEIWHEVFGEEKSIHLSSWPIVDKKALKEEMVTVAVQVDGKLRGTVEILADEAGDKQTVVEKALELSKVKKYVEGKKYEVVYVEGRVVNFVT